MNREFFLSLPLSVSTPPFIDLKGHLSIRAIRRTVGPLVWIREAIASNV